ncbi:hypothetical protein DR950_09865 [Kitasatospora xanthocidica]|uniref:Cytochrome P450 n=1 Tax=Kitasatospora xanthocidica TaxID=83382 RepID=A0A372ZS84_9ACTN|nr:hypothetical protein [Kitasatospora xanthocidica]RGD58055.1 hypothetical protein DR950_09865 [Kitasatospora xanthocidica]
MTTSPANPREVSDGDSPAPGQPEFSACPLIFDPQCPELPEDVLGGLREQAPVVRITLPGGLPAWMVTRFDDVRAGLGDPRLVQSPLSVPGFTGEDPRMAQIRWLGLPERMNQYLLRARWTSTHPTTPGCARRSHRTSPRAGSTRCNPGWSRSPTGS